MVPWLQSVSSFVRSDDPTLALRLIERRDTRTVSLSVDTARTAQGGRVARVLKIETRIGRDLPSKDAMEDLFRASNDELNEVFDNLIPREERQRFR